MPIYRKQEEAKRVRRLLTRCKQEKEDLREENKGLRAEVERLREALQVIVETDFPAPGPMYIAHIAYLKATAESALDGGGDHD